MEVAAWWAALRPRAPVATTRGAEAAEAAGGAEVAGLPPLEAVPATIWFHAGLPAGAEAVEEGAEAAATGAAFCALALAGAAAVVFAFAVPQGFVLLREAAEAVGAAEAGVDEAAEAGAAMVRAAAVSAGFDSTTAACLASLFAGAAEVAAAAG